ncbi:zinc finger protein 317-like [Bacillus rossius redtenbacheri]|uniref:zinc finger protein 317-like n=1 Tax=Bacillus rossius redtenbacheri TaxID=93214 RepID=UPI002FDE9452
MLVVDNSGRSTCKLCGVSLRTTYLRRHVENKHVPSEQVECVHCNKMFKSKSSLRPLGDKLRCGSRCDYCGKLFNKYALRTHIQDMHMPTVSEPCQFCHKLFRSRNSLRVHLSTFHRGSCGRNPRTVSTCSFCGITVRNNYLKTHIRDIHMGSDPVQCGTCHKLFKSKNSLNSHMFRYHRKDKN